MLIGKANLKRSRILLIKIEQDNKDKIVGITWNIRVISYLKENTFSNPKPSKSVIAYKQHKFLSKGLSLFCQWQTNIWQDSKKASLTWAKVQNSHRNDRNAWFHRQVLQPKTWTQFKEHETSHNRLVPLIYPWKAKQCHLLWKGHLLSMTIKHVDGSQYWLSFYPVQFISKNNVCIY